MSAVTNDFKYDLIVSLVVYKPNLEKLRQTLNSVYSTPLPMKVAIVDNSPAPLSDDFLRPYKNIAYVFNEENMGYGKAHNLNIERYSHEAPFFLVLNPDVYFDSLLLPEMTARMRSDSSVGLSIPRICHPCGSIQMVNRRLPRPQDYVMNFVNSKLKAKLLSTDGYNRYLLSDVNTDQPFVCPTISGCFMFFRGEVLRAVGGFDSRYFLYLEDTDLSRRVAKAHNTVVFSDLTAYHHWTRGAYKNPKLFLLFVNNLVRYFNKWGWVTDSDREKLNALVRAYPLKNRPNSFLKKPNMFDSL